MFSPRVADENSDELYGEAQENQSSVFSLGKLMKAWHEKSHVFP